MGQGVRQADKDLCFDKLGRLDDASGKRLQGRFCIPGLKMRQTFAERLLRFSGNQQRVQPRAADFRESLLSNIGVSQHHAAFTLPVPNASGLSTNSG